MNTTQPRTWKNLVGVVVSVLVLIASNSVLGQFYLQGGISSWIDFEAPDSILSDLPILDNESSVDGNSQYWLGAGYQVSDEWSFEAFYSKLPSTEVNSEMYIFFGGRPILPGPIYPQAISVTVNTETTTFGVGAVYDFYVNDRLSIIGKAGIAFTQQDSEVDIEFPRYGIGFPPIDYGDDDFELHLFPEDFYFDEDFFYGGDENSTDMYFAVGVRIPIQDSPASVTATYQFINTPDDSESGLFVGIRWEL